MNLVSLVLMLVGSFWYGISPLTPAQLLWLNIIMDTLGVLSLATEPPTNAVLTDEQPLQPGEKVVSPSMSRNIMLSCIFQLGLLLVMLFHGKEMFQLPYDEQVSFYTAGLQPTNKCVHYTMIFNSLIFQTIF